MKNTKEYHYLPFIRKEATVSNAPYGMIAINMGAETVFVNDHGIFGKDGKHLSTKEAKKLFKLA